MAIGGFVAVNSSSSSAHQASIVRHLARRLATSPTDAVPFVPDSSRERRALATLISKRVIVEPEPSRYYVDESKIGELRLRRRRVLRGAAFAALISAAAAVGLGALR